MNVKVLSVLKLELKATRSDVAVFVPIGFNVAVNTREQ